MPALAHDRLSIVEELEEGLRILRRRTRYFVAVVVTQLVLAAGLAVSLSLAVAGLSAASAARADQAALAKAAALQQAQAARFTQDFLAEQNYVCEVVAKFGVQFGLGPPPPVTVCQVHLR